MNKNYIKKVKMTNEERAKLAILKLKQEYPEVECTLSHRNAFELLVAVRLAAQCTDARVNYITPELFKWFPTAEKMTFAQNDEIESFISSCNFYKIKANDIINMSKMLVANYEGEVPKTIDELTKLPGIGRKSANVIIGVVYKKPAVIVDTHFMRITKRLGFHNFKDATKIEIFMRNILPESESTEFCHRTVAHGRAVCGAKNPKCNVCIMNNFCEKNGV